jgi:hypothetical protein
MGNGKVEGGRGRPATGARAIPSSGPSRPGAWNQQLAAAMLLPRPDRETRRVDDPDDREALRGLAAALPPSPVLCGIVLLLLAALR